DIPQSQAGLIHAVDARLNGPDQGVTYAILNTTEVGRITLTLSLSATEWWTGEPLTPGTYNLETRFYKGGAGWGEFVWDWKSMVTIQIQAITPAPPAGLFTVRITNYEQLVENAAFLEAVYPGYPIAAE
ncbi:unnamed protein product, partial [marine sediment metagenome]